VLRGKHHLRRLKAAGLSDGCSLVGIEGCKVQQQPTSRRRNIFGRMSRHKLGHLIGGHPRPILITYGVRVMYG